jgi:transcriptional regulator with XRE-family HTH domain
LNESLQRAMLRARLREDDVAAHLGVDPKTVRRWLSGRVPYPSSRAALANLVGMDETDLWPEARGPLSGLARAEELAAVYPHRWAIPRIMWARFFESAEHEISLLAYSALFLAEDSELLDIIRHKANYGVRVRMALGNPESTNVAQRGLEEGIGDAMAAKVRNAHALCSAVEVRECRSPAASNDPVQLYLSRRLSTLRESACLRHSSSPLARLLLPSVAERRHGHRLYRQFRESLDR